MRRAQFGAKPRAGPAGRSAARFCYQAPVGGDRVHGVGGGDHSEAYQEHGGVDSDDAAAVTGKDLKVKKSVVMMHNVSWNRMGGLVKYLL